MWEMERKFGGSHMTPLTETLAVSDVITEALAV